jgi:hypothetical protein
MLLGLGLLGLLASACTESREDPEQHMPRPEAPTLTLLVSNQSFAIERVDLAISIDGEPAVTGDFDVEGQHTWVPFDFAIGPGDHVMSVTSVAGSATLEQAFTMDDRRWGVVSYWSDSENPTELTLLMADEPPAFD